MLPIVIESYVLYLKPRPSTNSSVTAYHSIKTTPESKKKPAAFIDCILTSPNVPQLLQQKIISKLIQSKIQAKGTDADEDLELFMSHLSIAFQRHAEAFQSAVDQVVAIANDSKMKAEVDAIVLRLASVSKKP
jgi:hypothetical protein